MKMKMEVKTRSEEVLASVSLVCMLLVLSQGLEK